MTTKKEIEIFFNKYLSISEGSSVKFYYLYQLYRNLKKESKGHFVLRYKDFRAVLCGLSDSIECDKRDRVYCCYNVTLKK